MEGIRNAQSMIDPWWNFMVFCFSDDPLSPVCGQFWERIILGAVALGVAAVAFGVWKYLKYRRDFRIAMRAQAEREAIADEQIMRAHQWDGDKAYQSNLSDDEVQRRIREGVEQRRREVGPPTSAT